MIDVVTEDDGFIHRVGALEVIGNGFRHQFGALINHHRAVKIFLVVDAVVDQLAVFIRLAFGRAPALEIDVDVDAHHFVGGKEAVFDAFFERVDIHRVAEVIGAGDFMGLFRRGG